MLTRQLWLVAHLSDLHVIERVESVIGEGQDVYIADHPRRCLRLGIDMHETFDGARLASLRWITRKVESLELLRGIVEQQEPPT